MNYDPSRTESLRTEAEQYTRETARIMRELATIANAPVGDYEEQLQDDRRQTQGAFARGEEQEARALYVTDEVHNFLDSLPIAHPIMGMPQPGSKIGEFHGYTFYSPSLEQARLLDASLIWVPKKRTDGLVLVAETKRNMNRWQGETTWRDNGVNYMPAHIIGERYDSSEDNDSDAILELLLAPAYTRFESAISANRYRDLMLARVSMRSAEELDYLSREQLGTPLTKSEYVHRRGGGDGGQFSSNAWNSTRKLYEGRITSRWSGKLPEVPVVEPGAEVPKSIVKLRSTIAKHGLKAELVWKNENITLGSDGWSRTLTFPQINDEVFSTFNVALRTAALAELFGTNDSHKTFISPLERRASHS